MFWRSGMWEVPKDDDEARETVKQLGKQLAEEESGKQSVKTRGRQQTRLVFHSEAKTEMGQCPPSNETLSSSKSSNEKTTTEPDENSPTDAFQYRLVQTVEYRRLPFYPHDQDWRLYRFTCRIGPNGPEELAGYLPEAAFFAVRGPGNRSTPQWTVLDWTSPPLHRLNDTTGLKLEALGSEDRADYIQFFVSFLGSSEERDGLIHPFLIPDSFNEIFSPSSEAEKWTPPDDGETSRVTQDFEEFAACERLTLFDANDFTQNNDPFDVPLEDQPEKPKWAAERKQSDKNAREIVEDFFEEEQLNWFEGVRASQIDSKVDKEKSLFQLKAPMAYRGTLFEATLSVYPSGMILMKDDEPVPGAGWLPAPRWEVRRRPDEIRLLCLAQRRLLDLDELRRDLATPEGKHSPDRIVKHHRRIKERIDWSRTIKRTLVFKDVEFMEEVVLDDSLFERSLEFHECRFMQGLRLRNAVVNGSLILE